MFLTGLLSRLLPNAFIILFSLLAIALLPILYHHVSRNYKAFVALGSAGIPATIPGSLRTVVLSQLRLRNPLAPPTITPTLWLQRGYLENLPRRRGTRPQIAGIAPQRQLTQRSPEGMYEALSSVICDFANYHADSTYLGRSTFERHNTALFSCCRKYSGTHYFGEICHAHPSDGSMHLNLHPADVKTVIENGWGERHPLARNNYWWWWWFSPVPSGFTMVYAPRDEQELQVGGEIVKAAVWWVSGIDSKIAGESWS